MIKRILKSSFWIVTIVPIVFSMCSCWLIPTYHHIPHYLNQADVLFEDDRDSKIFCREDKRRPYLYVSDEPDYHKGLYIENAGHTNYERVVANSNYLMTILSYTYAPYRQFIMVFDKSYNAVKTIAFDDCEKVQDISCTENYLYIYLKNTDLEKYSLLRYDFNLDLMLVLIDKTEKAESYQDDDVHLFFIEYSRYDVRICDYGDLKTRIYENDGHFKTDKIDLYCSKNSESLIVNNEGEEFVFETNLPLNQGSYWFYDKVYLVNNQLLFALYKKSNKRQCTATYYGICICSLEESYLYKYDLSSNELSLIKQFDKGTFLIDYDLNEYKYYKDGGLFINDVLFRECENIYPEYEEHLTSDDKYIDYYFSYYNGEFYGI